MATQRIQRYGRKVIKGDLFVVDGKEQEVFVADEDTSSVGFENVVLPLPGYNIRYPENEIGKLYRDFLEKEKVSFSSDAPPEATAKGSYRRLIVHAANLDVSFDDDAEETTSSMTLKFDLRSGSYATSMLRELMLTTVKREGPHVR